ncbi:hypothetical protein [Terrisporobacter mayombei]|nr:hypothetical protein [Terrisporobacter mayombei]MCC3866581.1 hypothetical protein [Terrisporobacter mayombei]
MKKSVILFLVSMLMILFVGCSKEGAKEVAQPENLVCEKINNKYLYYRVASDRWDNKEYAYGVEKTFIFAFNNEKTTLYYIKEDKEECLQLANTKLSKDGYEIDYTFKSDSKGEYKLNVLLNKENKDEIKFTLNNRENKSYLIEENLLSKDECENKIKSTINEVELENMLATNFKEASNLDLDKIKSDIDKAREKLYEKTKESKNEIYYVYSPSGSYCEEDEEFKLQNYVFGGVYLDEHGEMLTINDFIYLVDANDFTLYKYSPNGNKKRIKYVKKSGESAKYENEVSKEKETSNKSTSSNSDKKGKYSKDEINKILEKGEDERACIVDGPVFYNNEWCYLVSYLVNTQTYRMSEYYIGSDTLEKYAYEEVNK